MICFLNMNWRIFLLLNYRNYFLNILFLYFFSSLFIIMFLLLFLYFIMICFLNRNRRIFLLLNCRICFLNMTGGFSSRCSPYAHALTSGKNAIVIFLPVEWHSFLWWTKVKGDGERLGEREAVEICKKYYIIYKRFLKKVLQLNSNLFN